MQPNPDSNHKKNMLRLLPELSAPVSPLHCRGFPSGRRCFFSIINQIINIVTKSVGCDISHHSFHHPSSVVYHPSSVPVIARPAKQAAAISTFKFYTVVLHFSLLAFRFTDIRHTQYEIRTHFCPRVSIFGPPHPRFLAKNQGFTISYSAFSYFAGYGGSVVRTGVLHL